MGFVKKSTVIRWSRIKLRQYNGRHVLKFLIDRKRNLHLVVVAIQ